MKKSISIVGIAHNGYGVFIPDWLKSVCDQTVKPKEVIIVLSDNHGLTGKLPKKINGIEINIINEPIKSRGLLRNKAMEIAKGEFIMFFDVDDVLLEHAVEEISKCDADVIAVKYFKEYKGQTELWETPIPVFEKLPEWRKYYCNASGYIAFRKSLGILHEDVDTPDYPFYFKALSQGATFQQTELPCAIYRKRDDGHAKKKTKEETQQDFTMIRESAMECYNIMKNDRA